MILHSNKRLTCGFSNIMRNELRYYSKCIYKEENLYRYIKRRSNYELVNIKKNRIFAKKMTS